MTLKISDTFVVKRAANQVCCDMDGESIILNLRSGIYYSLDEVGARIWALIADPMPVAEIRDAILREYDVQIEVCERDIRAFIERMDAAGLIEVPIEVKDEVGA
jgi:coenzyme PQQ synthesis protein D (PqqD)